MSSRVILGIGWISLGLLSYFFPKVIWETNKYWDKLIRAKTETEPSKEWLSKRKKWGIFIAILGIVYLGLEIL